MTVYAFITGARLANVLVHLLQAVYFRGLTPGVFTAVFLVLPNAVFLLHHLHKQNLISPCQLRAALIAGLPLHVLIAPLLLFTGWAANVFPQR